MNKKHALRLKLSNDFGKEELIPLDLYYSYTPPIKDIKVKDALKYSNLGWIEDDTLVIPNLEKLVDKIIENTKKLKK